MMKADLTIILWCYTCEDMRNCNIEISEPRLKDEKDPNYNFLEVEIEAVCELCNHGVDIDKNIYRFPKQ